MKMLEKWFVRRLDRLSGTYPNDERVSRINEKGFALCGLCYIIVLTCRFLYGLIHYQTKLFFMRNDVFFDVIVLGIMLLIILAITLRQRRTETPVQEQTKEKLHLAELPRFAAKLLTGKCPKDERTVQAFERGFAVCALIGFAYFSVSFLLFYAFLNHYFFTTVYSLFAAPVLLGYVKLHENILTPPRFANIRLSTKHLLLRLPVYLLAVLPYLFVRAFFPTAFDTIGGDLPQKIYSENLFVMFFQVVGDGFKNWVRHPFRVPADALCYAVLIYLAVVILFEYLVFLYRRQMKKMDAEENDLS